MFKAELDRARRALLPLTPEGRPGDTELLAKGDLAQTQPPPPDKGVEAAENNLSGAAPREN